MDPSPNESRPGGQDSTRISKVRNLMSQCLVVLVFNIVKFSSGTSLGFTVVLLGKFHNETTFEIPMSLAYQSWFGAYCFTGPVGAIAIAIVAHLIGSRTTLLLGSSLFVASWVIFYYARSAAHLLIAQAIVGINISTILGPGVAYVVEISQPNLRSTFMATTNLSMILGQFFTVLLNNWLHWRTIVLVNLAFPIVGLVSMFFFPESPHWLASKGKYEEAERSLAWLRGWATPEDVEVEFRLLRETQQKSRKDLSTSSLTGRRRLANMFKLYVERSFYIPLAIICLTFLIQALVGSHTVQTFAIRLFKILNSPLDKKMAGTIFDGLRIAGAIVCISTVHLLGRRKLMFFSLAAGAITYLMAAVSIHLTTRKYLEAEVYLYLPSVMIIASTFVFAAGLDKVVNMLNGELFPSRFRNVGTGVGSFVGAVFSMIMSKQFLYMIDYMTIQGVFLFFGVMSAFGFVLLYRMIPETEGKTLMEIEEHYAQARSFKDCEIQSKTQVYRVA
ncbi:facilitated trehalose transporter Tret1-like isoform X2 [Copidosoma floridanum]|uniref:facilitated trehalose transporter Tret1-like isoform X2 n=1 Tax=Copidosoma floridanum TaxID=29053 RepID=UPI0006C9695D|nr:facilitated trehalose transporter Tret1-like isoform X2 [Copidosoma floridanum]